MAIDMFYEAPSLATSPRISSDSSSQNQQLSLSTFEFDFCISSETSSADELFSDGLIRPLQLQQKFVTPISKQVSFPKTQTLLNSLPPLLMSQSENAKIPKQQRGLADESEQQKCNSFWSIKRSSSVHCVTSNKKTSFWSLPLLSRSNSTGSVPNTKQLVKEGQKQKQMKNSTPVTNFYTFPSSQKPPLRKNYGGPNYGNAIRINPVLNVPFGLCSLFRNGKDKKISKKL